MTDVEGRKPLTRNDVFADFGRRVKNGYDPGRVEKHLRRIADGVSDLTSQINGDAEVSESVELVMKATRRSVDSALSDAHARAGEIVSAAESHATTITISAEQLAAERLNEVERDLSDRIADSESRLGAIEELIEQRQTELREFEVKVSRRLSELRSASDAVRDLSIHLALPSTPDVIDLVDEAHHDFDGSENSDGPGALAGPQPEL